MRILLMNSEYPPVGGGAGNASANIARELAALGQDVCVLTTAFGSLPKDEMIDGVRIVRVRSFRHRADRSGAFEQSVFVLVASFGLLGLLRQWKPDVILAFFGVPAGVVALKTRLLFKIPYVVSLRGGDVPGFRPYDFGTYHRIIAPLLRKVWKNAVAIVANSAGLRALAMKFEDRYPISIIPNGVNVERFTPPAARHWDVPRLLFVGRFVHQKGLDLLLPALGQLTDLPWDLTAIGDGPERSALEALAARLSIADRIHFVGWQRGAELEGHYRDANLFVLPSRHEGMPNVVLEAMATGLPCVATDVSGSRELIRDGETGFLFQPGDATSLRHCLLKTVGGAAERMGQAGRRMVEKNYSINALAEKYERLYEQLLAGGK